ncbi:hypothetical protein CT19425_U350041 [Cupriavidus taiwanensis]|uniref:Uncharacterized protein n=1 Tax=Cupriavidus taiwanensis TaxID=164546 RepID=A0A375I8B3_9BURK|nr:hypothetical protein CT19425_U350041 [Cupriavidus taiwanensis]
MHPAWRAAPNVTVLQVVRRTSAMGRRYTSQRCVQRIPAPHRENPPYDRSYRPDARRTPGA